MIALCTVLDRFYRDARGSDNVSSIFHALAKPLHLSPGSPANPVRRGFRLVKGLTGDHSPPFILSQPGRAHVQL
ncbi:hypothetical protein AcW1_009656 [Taiwanofungus camphoratus]|nr:hypothetical protein AcW1_009656 [Antrodia cinnamomea]